MYDTQKQQNKFLNAIVSGMKKIFKYVVRLLEFATTYLIPSFLISYITLYFPTEESWKALCLFAYLLTLIINTVTSRAFYRSVENDLKRYFRITYITYAIIIGYSVFVLATAEANLLLLNFTISSMRAFELFYEKTWLSMLLAHVFMIAVVTVAPLLLRDRDKKNAQFDKVFEESQKVFDKMGMVFNPDELPDVHEEVVVEKNIEEDGKMLFNPDELPDPVMPEEQIQQAIEKKTKWFNKKYKYNQSYEDYTDAKLLFNPNEAFDNSIADAKDDEEHIGLLFDPNESSEQVVNNSSDDNEEYVGLLFDPDEMPEEKTENSIKKEDDEDYVGLLFDPDEVSETEIVKDVKQDEEEPVGLLFDPDELPDIKQELEHKSEEEENFGLLFDPNDPE